MQSNLAFGFGWIFSEDAIIKNVEINLLLHNDTVITQLVDYGKHREDVESAFPDSPHALKSGFLFYSAWKGKSIKSIYLTVNVTDNLTHKITIFEDTPEHSQSIRHEGNPRKYLIRKAALYIKRGKFRALWEKWLSHNRSKPVFRDSYFESLCNTILSTQSGKAVLIIDHNLGGGANEYRNQIIKEMEKAGKNVVLIGYNVPTLQYFSSLHSPGNPLIENHCLDSFDSILTLLNRELIDEVIFNNSVSFDRPEIVPDILYSISYHYGIPVTLMLHDFLVICPSHFLINNKGEFCDLPDINICRDCLLHNKEPFVSLYVKRSIDQWRNRWERCLSKMTAIICFSESSRDILFSAYPSLEKGKVRIVPHKVDYFPDPPPLPIIGNETNIGVVGQIGKHKGAEIVSDLSFYIASNRLPIKISIIGLLEADYEKRVLCETGAYKKVELLQLIEKSNANIFFFPSIWPETFSMVTEELITLNVPIVCFSFGAPAERVKNYRFGRTIPFTREPKKILSSIQEFLNELREQQDSDEGEI